MAQYAFPSNFGAIFGKIGKAIMGSESSVKIKTFSFVWMIDLKMQTDKPSEGNSRLKSGTF